MRKTSTVWLNLCLSSLMVAVSLVAATPVQTSASTQSEQILAQSKPCAGKKTCASANPCASKKT